MSLILDGSNGLSDVDGSAATPAIRGTDTNTGIFFPAADTIAFSEGGAESMRIDGSGNLGIGTTSPTSKLDVSGEVKTLNDAAAAGVIIKRTGGVNANGAVNFVGSDDAVDASVRMATDVANALVFTAGGATERMRLNSGGDVFMGTTTSFPGDGNTATGFMYQASAGKIFTSCSGGNTAFNFNLNGTGQIGFFCSSGTRVGNISVTGSTTAYNSGSDYRLKNNIQPLTNALDKVALLKPSKWTWKADETYGDGFVAHELAEVCPQAITGEKDAVDEDGKPVYQGVDTSFLVATLTAAIQELKATVDAQAARIAALESAKA
jgi:hypothetical protein